MTLLKDITCLITMLANTFLCSYDSQGVCIGLSEVMASAGKNQLLSFMDELIPTIRTALSDRFLFSFMMFLIL